MRILLILFAFCFTAKTSAQCTSRLPETQKSFLSKSEINSLVLNQENQVTYVIPIYALRVSDTDGSRKTAISAGEVRQWIDHTNKVFVKSKIRFYYEDSIHDLVNTDVNNHMAGFIIRSQSGGYTLYNLDDQGSYSAVYGLKELTIWKDFQIALAKFSK